MSYSFKNMNLLDQIIKGCKDIKIRKFELVAKTQFP